MCTAVWRQAKRAHVQNDCRRRGACMHVRDGERSHVQAVEALSDDYMHVAPGSSASLLSDVSDALALPAALKMKWLRADCLTALDLSAPGDGWGLSAWQRLVMCLHAVPALQALAVCLPRYPIQSLRQPVERPLTVRECNLCGQSGTLHFNCSLCRCGLSAGVMLPGWLESCRSGVHAQCWGKSRNACLDIMHMCTAICMQQQ